MYLIKFILGVQSPFIKKPKPFVLKTKEINIEDCLNKYFNEEVCMITTFNIIIIITISFKIGDSLQM